MTEMSTALPHHKAGELRILAVASAQPWRLPPACRGGFQTRPTAADPGHRCRRIRAVVPTMMTAERHTMMPACEAVASLQHRDKKAFIELSRTPSVAFL